MTVKNRIHKLLHERGIREVVFAREIGMDQASLNRIKNGRIEPKIATALRIARGLKLPVEEVFYLECEGEVEAHG